MKIKRNRLVKLLFVFIIFFSSVGLAKVEAKDLRSQPYRPSEVVKKAVFNSYQNYISPINQGSCPMYPTCSGYIKDSFKNHSFLQAVAKSSDRLLRCSNDLSKYEKVRFKGRIRYKDLVVDRQISSLQKVNQSSGIKMKLNFKQHNFSSVKNANAELLYEFANQLYNSQKYEQAITEYKRLLSYYPQTVYRKSALQAVFTILYQQDNYLEAIDFGKDVLESEDRKIINTTDWQFVIGSAYFRLENFRLARKYFNEVQSSGSKDLKNKSYLLTGVGFAHEKKWTQAIEAFNQVSSSSNFHNKAQEFINLAQEGKKINYNSPRLATILGIVPGGGYLYTGHKQTAISSLLMNGLLFLGTKKAFDNGNKALGTLLGTFNFGLYSGNIYGSFKTAKRENKGRFNRHLTEFKLNFRY